MLKVVFKSTDFDRVHISKQDEIKKLVCKIKYTVISIVGTLLRWKFFNLENSGTLK